MTSDLTERVCRCGLLLGRERFQKAVAEEVAQLSRVAETHHLLNRVRFKEGGGLRCKIRLGSGEQKVCR